MAGAVDPAVTKAVTAACAKYGGMVPGYALERVLRDAVSRLLPSLRADLAEIRGEILTLRERHAGRAEDAAILRAATFLAARERGLSG